MSETSTIEWTQATWNPVTGCTKVSPGCAHCYAETWAERWRGVPGHPFEQGFDLQLRPERLKLPLSWKRPRLVFVNSMSDLFHEAVPAGFIAEAFETMRLASWHTFQVLTKRPERALQLAAELPWPANVWMGTSVENQRWTSRVEILRTIPAQTRFLSCEPLLGPIRVELAGIDWVICGGESGPRARRMDPDWARSLRDQCVAAGVPFFFKQWGAFSPDGRRVGKGRAGRDLDGRTWDEMPALRRDVPAQSSRGWSELAPQRFRNTQSIGPSLPAPGSKSVAYTR